MQIKKVTAKGADMSQLLYLFQMITKNDKQAL